MGFRAQYSRFPVYMGYGAPLCERISMFAGYKVREIIPFNANRR